MSRALEQYPRLSRAARLRFDRQTQSYVLLSPERGLRLNPSAAEIVQRCTGERTVRQIVDELHCDAAVQPTALVEDVLGLLLALQERRLLVFEPPP